ncbi:RluA family pseudouridine synthase [Vibrio tritonius]|uniref:RluA family pseudouridine synthase n=1 Tax=Vibrio tritonius TaxID=1435069 RepID=UPI000838972C|nr:RluA family pseudouridine synthase [Vibrio tritonius]
MQSKNSCFTPFLSDVSAIALPEKFTYPFCYEPHPLCEMAAKQLQQHLLEQSDWSHPFGLDSEGRLDEKNGDYNGKMFGVLVVKNAQGALGFLSAFSGLLADQLIQPGFVPPVYDRLSGATLFRQEADEIAAINQQVKSLEQSQQREHLLRQLARLEKEAQQETEALRLTIIEQRKLRKAERESIAQNSPNSLQEERLAQLARESVAEKRRQQELKAHWLQIHNEVNVKIEAFESQLADLKQERKHRSAKLQQHLFEQYQLLNCSGETKSLLDIFAEFPKLTPPAGSGECAAPKLLQYAFKHQFTPICMAEFWWGKSPKSEIRQHKKYYPACQNKCFPILSHMLKNMTLDDNPLLQNPAQDKEIEILYQDEAIVVVNKPAELLSVPGVHIKDSVATRLTERFSDKEGLFVLHRLDMSTSGLLVFALTKRANKQLQKQFITRQVKKRYVAILSGKVNEQHGEITLPLRGDLNDRPRQIVCLEHGKPALTTWECIAQENDGSSRVYLYPHTGRTHQLRVHCAHSQGLNLPIKGDDLYGTKADRLHLHAEQLSFTHPYTRQPMTFTAKPDF